MKKRLSKCLAFMLAIALSVIMTVTPIAQAATNESTEIGTETAMEISTENSSQSLEEATLDMLEEEQEAEVDSQTVASTSEQIQEANEIDVQQQENNSAMEASEETQEAVETSEEMTTAEEPILVGEEKEVKQETAIEEENIAESQREDAVAESQIDTVSNVPDVMEINEISFELYKANLAFKEGNNPVNNGVPPYIDSIQPYHLVGHPSNVLMQDLNASDRFMTNVMMYQFWTMDPSRYAGEVTKEGDFYTAILLAMLNIATTDDAMVEAYNSKWKTTAATASSWLIDGMKNEYNITLSSGSKLADVDRDKLQTYFQKMLKDKYNMADNASQGIKLFDYYIDTLTTVQDIVNAFSNYICLYQMEEGMFDVLREMQNHTSDSNMKYALGKIISCEDDALASISNAMLESEIAVIQTVYKNVIGSMWSGMMEISPLAPVYFAQQAASTLCNFCLSTDEISEQYWKMDAICKVEEALYASSMALGENFVNNKTEENAKKYNCSIDLYFNLYQESGEYAKTFADIVFKKSLGGALSKDEGYQKFLRDVNSLQSQAEGSYEALQKSYINYLEEDYPEVYQFLLGYDVDPGIAVTGISIEEDTLEWGTKDSFLYIPYTINPSDASNQFVFYSISDETVVSQIRNGLFEVHKPGTAVITVTTEDGGYSDSVTIHTVEGHGEYGIQEVKPVNVVDSGTCGDKLSWYLVDNGNLYINGTGQMKNYRHGIYHYCDAPWYDYREKIKEVYLSDGVTSIGGGAFFGCKSLSTIEISNSVTSIGWHAFEDCSSLSMIEIPNSVMYIEGYAFYGCSSLSTIDLPNSVTSIGWNAFEDCSSLSMIKIPNSVTNIEWDTFSGCRSLSTIEIPNSVTSIGKGAFEDCSSLSTIEIPNSVTSIGEGAFYDCRGLNTIKILNSNCEIEDRSDTISSTAVIYGYKNSTAEAYATKYGRKFVPLDGSGTEVCIHDFQQIEKKAPTCMTEGSITKECSKCKKRQTEVLESTKDITNCTASLSESSYTYDGNAKEPTVILKDGEIVVPVSAYKVTYSNNIEIGKATVTITGINGYKGKLETSFTIQNSENNEETGTCGKNLKWNLSDKKILTISGTGDMYDCVEGAPAPWLEYSSDITEIKIENGVTSIGANAFGGCVSLKAITLPNSLTRIGANAFESCESLTSIKIPRGVKKIEEGTFFECSKLSNVTISDTVTMIEDGLLQVVVV